MDKEPAPEALLAEKYIQIERVCAFDRLVDLALDGQIDLQDAIDAYKTEVGLSDGR